MVKEWSRIFCCAPFAEVFVNSLWMCKPSWRPLQLLSASLRGETVTLIQATQQIKQLRSKRFAKFSHLPKNASHSSVGRFTDTCHAWMSGLILQKTQSIRFDDFFYVLWLQMNFRFLVKLAFSGRAAANYRTLKIDQMMLSKTELFPQRLRWPLNCLRHFRTANLMSAPVHVQLMVKHTRQQPEGNSSFVS